MSDPVYITSNEFNGLGSRVNSMEKECSACKADKQARLEAVDSRQDEHREQISLLFKKMDEVKATINKAMGGIAVAVAAIQVVSVLVERALK